MASVGYVRVSTSAQDVSLQRDALIKAGCGRIFEDTISGATAERPGLNEALAFLREEDVLVVWKLDRLGRSFEVDPIRRTGLRRR
jgi:DNA invertase Pin-like site-specific DNA recombinase